MCLRLKRKRFIQNGQLWVGFTHNLPPRATLKATRIKMARPDLLALDAGPGGHGAIVHCSPNNWLRRIFYAFKVRKSWIRAV